MAFDSASNLYKHGMYWMATAPGSINGQTFDTGEYIYAVGDPDADFLTLDEVSFELSLNDTYQGQFTPDGSSIPEPTWDGPVGWPHPTNLIRISQVGTGHGQFNLISSGYEQGPPGSMFVRKFEHDDSAGAASPYVWPFQDAIVSTLDQYSASAEVRISIDISSSIGMDLRFDGVTFNSTSFSYPTANEWVKIYDEGTRGEDASASPGEDNLWNIIYISNGLIIDAGDTLEYGAVQLLKNPGTTNWSISDVPYRPHPQDWYKDGMYWVADADGFVNGVKFEAGDRIYAIGDTEADYLLPGEVTFTRLKDSYKRPFYVVEEPDNSISVIFKTVNPIEEKEDNLYYLYYGSKSETRLLAAEDILDSNNLELTDLGQDAGQGELTRWTFQKPSVIWINNASDKDQGKGVFEFIGHKVDIYFQTGPKYGKFEYQVNDSEKVLVDCYSGTEGESKLVSIDTQNVQTNKVRIITTGQKNPASSSSSVKLTKCKYHQVLVGELGAEEFYATLGKSYTVGL